MKTTIRHTALAAALALISTQAVRAQDGAFDPTFYNQGRNLIAFGYENRPIEWGNSIAVRSDGYLILGGDCAPFDASNSPVCIAWLRPNGTPIVDQFGNFKRTVFGDRTDLFPGERHQMAFHGLALQRDDRPVLASYHDFGGRSESRVTRLSPGGDFEALADGAYYRSVLFQPWVDPAIADNVINAVAIGPDGKVVVAGTTRFCCGQDGGLLDLDMGVARFNADMTLDASFGGNGDGARTIAFDQGGDNFDKAVAVAVQNDRKIVVAGIVRSGGGSASTDAAIARLNADGSLDTSFGNGGKATIPPIAQPNGSVVVNSVNTVVIDRRGRILIAGSVYRGDLSGAQGSVIEQFVARFTPDGVLDTSFGHFVGGVTIFGWSFTNPGQDETYSLVLQGDGKILLLGSAATNQQSVPASYWVVARLLPNGESADMTSYGGYSPPQGPFPATNDARGAVIANGGLILTGRAFNYLVGDNSSYFGVAKLQIDAIFKDGFDP